MGITNVNKQQAAQPTNRNTWTSRGIATPMDGTRYTMPGYGYPDELVTLDFQKYESLTKLSLKPAKAKAAKRKATQYTKPSYIKLFERIRWSIGPK